VGGARRALQIAYATCVTPVGFVSRTIKRLVGARSRGPVERPPVLPSDVLGLYLWPVRGEFLRAAVVLLQEALLPAVVFQLFRTPAAETPDADLIANSQSIIAKLRTNQVRSSADEQCRC
jgi:hypothetical protein